MDSSVGFNIFTVLLWTGEPGPYVRAAEAAGLARECQFTTAAFPASRRVLARG